MCRSMFNSGLTALWYQHRREQLSLELFLKLYGDLLPTILPASDLDAVTGATGDWGAVADNILRLTSSGLLGSKMFGFAKVHVLSAQIAVVLDKKVKEPSHDPSSVCMITQHTYMLYICS